MKTDKYRRLLSCCPSLLGAADKTANDMNEDLQNNIPAQVTAYVTAPVLFCYVCYILDSVKKNNINRIFFLSRDGYILKQIADIIIERKNSNTDELSLCFTLFASQCALLQVRNSGGFRKRRIIYRLYIKECKEFFKESRTE